ncbi:hypothetical protein XA68_11934 [Ophiocordyceps unilateralis]|uniref:GH16 domain-containing protein n=1 Tax=Ophiocordyceps unilateralis TaxID=268505 RepID=A0A2A9PFT3_OPHUN|nr:hypothetical protein XA68_11934 [Ophiocordyceps unilateralis]
MKSLGFLVLVSLTPRLVAALCECGFAVKGTDDGHGPWLFTNVLESDFTKGVKVSENKDWVRQQFNVSAKAGRGRYGKSFSLDNILSHDPTVRSQGASALQLRVGSMLNKDAVTAAEMDSARNDLHWGSYRAGMKLTAVNGTCSAFFWYLNDTQEIDMEFLSHEYDADKGVYPINLAIQSKKSMEAGYDATRTATYRRVNLTFDPTAAFHEYRFDYLPGRVAFYADSVKLAEMEGDEMPKTSGHLILQHWSNGDPMWSGGPPAQDALLTVSYVKAYFNSSDNKASWEERCGQSQGTAICTIPDVTAANASTGGHFFTDGRSRKEGGEADSGCAGEGGYGLTAMAMATLAMLVNGTGRGGDGRPRKRRQPGGISPAPRRSPADLPGTTRGRSRGSGGE